VRRRVALSFLLAALAPAPAAAQEEARPGLRAPRVVASGAAFLVAGRAPAGARVLIEIGVEGRWRALAAARADGRGRFERRVRPKRLRRRIVLRARVDGGRSSAATPVHG